jgi:hypothetical protein
MKWVGKLLRKLIDSSYDEPEKISNILGKAQSAELHSHSAYNISVFHAIGGKVVEFRRYDRRADTSDHQVYVINDSDEFSERLAKIIAMENMK